MRERPPAIFALAALLAVLALGSSVAPVHAACRLDPGFKMLHWGMGVDELKQHVPGAREDVNRFEPEVVAYHSFQFPNNGFSEFRFFRGKLFYMRLKFTSARYAEQLQGGLDARCKVEVVETVGVAKRMMWRDDQTAVALYLFPYHSEIRAKSREVSRQWMAYRKKEKDVENFLDEQIRSAFSRDDLSEKDARELIELRKSLQEEKSDDRSGEAKP